MRRLTFTCLAALAALAACSEPVQGHCTGTLAGEPFDADIDPESEHHTVQRRVCTQAGNKTRWHFRYGGGALQIAALSTQMTNSSISTQEISLPPQAGTRFEEWRVLSPAQAQMLPGGTLTLPESFDLSTNLFGTFRFGLADGSELECSFSLPKGPDEGVDLDCPDEHDDWDDDD